MLSYTKQHFHNMRVAEMTMKGWLNGKPVKMEQGLRWFDIAQPWPFIEPMRKSKNNSGGSEKD